MQNFDLEELRQYEFPSVSFLCLLLPRTVKLLIMININHRDDETALIQVVICIC